MGTNKEGRGPSKEVTLKHFASCTRCSLGTKWIRRVWGEGSPDASIILIGEAPGEQENRLGRPFIGDAGQVLRRILEKTGLPIETFYITNALRCWPGKGNKIPKGEELKKCLEACRFWTTKEFLQFNPTPVVLLGGTALRAITGKDTVKKLNGREVMQWTWVTYHPSFILQNPVMGRIEADIYRTIYKACRRAKLPIRRQPWHDDLFSRRRG